MAMAEHLVLEVVAGTGNLRGSRYRTKYHENLGDNLQRALEVLECEGWEVVTSFVDTTGVNTLLFKRIPR